MRYKIESKRHGGEIYGESNFSIKAQITPNYLKNMKILLIDDNISITNMLVKYMKMKGIECIASNNGVDGLELIKRGGYDAVLLDLSMPEVSGYDIIDELEKEGKLKSNKIILFTASSIVNDEMEKLKNRGIAAFVKKPVQLQNLLDVLKNN